MGSGCHARCLCWWYFRRVSLPRHYRIQTSSHLTGTSCTAFIVVPWHAPLRCELYTMDPLTSILLLLQTYQPRCHLCQLRLSEVPMAQVSGLHAGSDAWGYVRLCRCLWQLQISYRRFRRWPKYPNCPRLQRPRISRYLLYLSSTIHDADGHVLLRVHRQHDSDVHDLRPQGRG